ncbi:MAG: hypothetical protein J1E61_05155 [Lachnospiraceae bacterium]|nr:hypothetical protein [Lachnospiraceae bacterium]
MDNFMDKLARRFNAGEMIKANAQAEARDLKRAKERAAEYERLMQEMRRLNLKNVEVTEQVQQLIQCGIEQFEGYGSSEALLMNKIDQTEEAVKEDISAKLLDLERLFNQSMLQNQRAIADAMRELEEKAGDDSGLEDSFERLETAISSSRYATEDSIRQLAEAISNIALSFQNVEGQFQAMEESLRSTRELLVAMRMSMDENQKHLEDHVHKENVRVYRNVQASIQEETSKKAREMGERLNKLELSAKKNAGLKPLVLLTFLLSLAGLAIQIMQMM